MSHYELLQVRPTASVHDLRQAFRTLSKRYHPDTTKLPPAEASVYFQELQHAYAILINPERRQVYDAELDSIKFSQSIRTLELSRVEGNRRSFSGGEWFAIVLLCVSMGACLILGLALVWIRGEQAVPIPIWLEKSYSIDIHSEG
uniref:DnaJ protein n=1 Tax=Paulinella longichromatophora TaxID=1708747 RepID=A0A2H4ZNR8_9EUKA|nr:DnaJ protein [Paulinella longichromatophora]